MDCALYSCFRELGTPHGHLADSPMVCCQYEPYTTRLTLPAFVLGSVVFGLKKAPKKIRTFFLVFYDLLRYFLLLSFCFVFLALASLQLFYLVAADVEHLSRCVLSRCFVFVLFFSYCSTAYKETVLFFSFLFFFLFFLLYIHPHRAIFLQSRLPALHPWVNKCLAWMVYCIILFFALLVRSKNRGSLWPTPNQICIATQAVHCEIYPPTPPHNYIAESIPPPRPSSLAGCASHLTSFDADGWIYIPTQRN